MKLIKLENEELNKAVSDGDLFVQIGNRKFVLFEVEEIGQSDYYDVTDPEEEKLLLEALNDDTNSYNTQKVLKLLSEQRE
jgi:hypothetical protein